MTTTTPTTPNLHIAILGAGIGGLALAISLSKHSPNNLTLTLYESSPAFSALGAGIGFGPNTLSAIALIDARFREQYERAATANARAEFAHSIYDALYAEPGFGEKRGWTRGLVGAPYFVRSSAHRRDLLEIMAGLVPGEVVRFGKRAVEVVEEEVVEEVGGRKKKKKVVVRFEDGEVGVFDAVVGCDGVKGMTRQAVLGDVAPEEVPPTYCGMYVYRGIIPMDEAKEILGEHAGDAKWFMAEGKGLVIYPISKGKEENFVFFVKDDEPWTRGDSAVPCTTEEMRADLPEFDHRLLKILDWAMPLRWPTWHHPETSTYYKGRLCLLGDVAHAMSPHQAAGAGQALEDAVVLAHLLALVKTPEELEPAFQVYDAIRRPRAQKVVTTSLAAGIIKLWLDPELGSDMEKIVENGNESLHWIWQHDISADLREAEDQFYRLVGHGRTEPIEVTMSKM
ncbi:6-methylsalicylic acid decarboxylase atA [Lasiodiplodia hormozganensis]|uniref:6-methylsalicylic acid decarboxylase atA n=1 Tax=Lasiodiplodia hormozganensis TaxID=869390 RepID=A0AA39WNL0_9PEZI|nr:6-methylsalicylic acid decarboxylase atA [Lasiodiplodia hormozganensis]